MEFSLKYLILFLLLIITLIYVGPILGGEFYHLAIGKINNITGIQNNTLNQILGSPTVKDCSNVKNKCSNIQQQAYNNWVLTQQVYGSGNSYENQISGDKYLTLSDLNGIKIIVTSTRLILPKILNKNTFDRHGENLPTIEEYKRTTIGTYSFKNNLWSINYKYNNESVMLQMRFIPSGLHEQSSSYITTSSTTKEITKTQKLNKNFNILITQFKKDITNFMAGKDIPQIINNKNYGNVTKYEITIPTKLDTITITYSKEDKMKVDYQNPELFSTIINSDIFPYPFYKVEIREGAGIQNQNRYTTLYYSYTCFGIKKYNLKQGSKNNPAIKSYINFDLRCLGVKPKINGVILKGKTAVETLLNFIGILESQNNYDMLIGGTIKKDLTSMTLNQILIFQSTMMVNGYTSTAVGKYQIIRSTLENLIGILKNQDPSFNSNKVLFDKATQDKFAIMLLQKRGLNSFLTNSMDTGTFANNLALEWASLPTQNGQSHYIGVGNNRAGTTWITFENTLATVKSQYITQNSLIASTSKSKTPVSS